MTMNSVFGISYGNSTASIAVYKEDGRIDIIANDAGDRTTATSVYISSSEKIVGLATGGNVSRVAATVTRNKSFLESDLTEERFDAIKSTLVVKAEMDSTASGGQGQVSYRIPDGDSTLTITPLEVAVLIFKKLFVIGRSAVGEGTLRCVLAVPHYWSEETRSSVKVSAEKAGWTVMQLVSEPSAALLSYLPKRQPVDATCLIFRVGGYSCEATVIQVVSGFYRKLGSRRSDVGVREIIDAVTKHLADEFRRKTRLEATESRKCMCKLWAASETMVRTLSSLPTLSLYLESLCHGVDLTAGLSRARLDSLLSGIVPLLLEPVHTLLSQLSLLPHNIDKVISVGGGLNIPRLRSEVASIFSSSGSTELCDYLQPQEVTAVGAATQAGLLVTTFQSQGRPLPRELDLPTLSLKLLKAPLLFKLSTGEELRLEGAVPVSKTVTVNLDERSSSLEVSAASCCGEKQMSATTRFDGYDSTPTPLRVTLQLSQDSLQVDVLDLSTNLSQQAPLILTPS